MIEDYVVMIMLVKAWNSLHRNGSYCLLTISYLLGCNKQFPHATDI